MQFSNNLRGSPAGRGQRLGMLVEPLSERALPGYRHYAEDLAQAIEIRRELGGRLGGIRYSSVRIGMICSTASATPRARSPSTMAQVKPCADDPGDA